MGPARFHCATLLMLVTVYESVKTGLSFEKYQVSVTTHNHSLPLTTLTEEQVKTETNKNMKRRPAFESHAPFYYIFRSVTTLSVSSRSFHTCSLRHSATKQTCRCVTQTCSLIPPTFISTNYRMQTRIHIVYCIMVGSRRLMPPDALQPKAYCTNLGL